MEAGIDKQNYKHYYIHMQNQINWIMNNTRKHNIFKIIVQWFYVDLNVKVKKNS